VAGAPLSAATAEPSAFPLRDRQPPPVEETSRLARSVPPPLEELSLELSAQVQSLGAGLFRLPLTVRAGARTKSVLLSFSLSLEDESE
jgi:hypothetical protein